jgi:hypothetical protein
MFNLNHTLEEVQIIITALSKLPFEVVHQLIPKIQNQVNPQIQAQQSTPTPETTPEQ